jgi:predicted dehydrogenase
VAAAWDLSEEICAQIKTAHPGVTIVGNAEEIIRHPQVEMVYIGTPPVTHVDYGLRVAKQGKALYMEKPLSIQLSEGEKLVRAVEAANIPSVMNFGFAAGPVVDTLSRVIDKGEIGTITSIEIRYQFPSWPLPNQLSASGWITNRNTGGMVREMFSHHVYLIRRLLGPLTVESATISFPPGENSAEDFAMATLRVGEIPVRFMGGVGSPATPRNSDFTLNGEFSSIRISEGLQLLEAQDGDWMSFPLDSTRTSVEARLDQIADLLEGKPTRLPSVSDGFEVQQVVESLLTAGNR